MPRVCTICASDDRQAMESLLAGGKTYRGIARTFSVSEDAITRHVKRCIPAALEALRQSQKEQSGLVVEDEVQRVFRRLNKLIDACDEWLTDPENEDKYTLSPRDNEIDCTFLDPTDLDSDGRPKRKRTKLRELVARLEGAQYEVLTLESKHADPRELVVKTAAQIANQLELYGKFRGLFQKPRENDKDIERREQEAVANRVWAQSLVKTVVAKKKLSEEGAANWVRENVPTASQWLN